MESRFKVLGHGAHPILIVFPLGLLSTSVIFDVIYFVTGEGQFPVVAYWMIIAGVVGGIVAAVPGFVDWLAIPKGTRARRVGLLHAVGNDIVLLLFAISWWMRRGNPPEFRPDTIAFLLSAIAFLLSMATGWLGGELVERLGVAVHDGAHLDAPNSLSGRPARDRE